MSSGKKLLIIEDIYDTVEGTVCELRFHGWDVACANSIADARETLRNDKYDAILLDWWIPELRSGDINKNGGGIVLNALRAGELGTTNLNVPVIVYTAHLDYLNLFDNSSYNLSYKKFAKLVPPSEIARALEEIVFTENIEGT